MLVRAPSRQVQVNVALEISNATFSYTYRLNYLKSCNVRETYALPVACPSVLGAPAARAIPETLRVLTYDVFGTRTTTNTTFNHDEVLGVRVCVRACVRACMCSCVVRACV